MDLVHFFSPSPVQIVHDLDNPMVVVVPDRRVSITADFVVGFGDRSRNSMRVEVSGGGTVLEADNRVVNDWGEFAVRVNGRGPPSWEDGPLVIVVLVVVAGDLLLLRPGREGLDVRVK